MVQAVNATDTIYWARYYATRCGWYILPVHSVGPDRQCTCGEPCGDKAGKHPRISEWQHKASNDEDQIIEWWTRWPNANIAVNCGLSDLVVVDFDLSDDGRHGANVLQEFLAAREIAMPPTNGQVLTGGGGNHAFYRMSPYSVGSKNGWLEGVDIKATGGYVLLPPSNHLAGMLYDWMFPLSEDGIQIGELTPELAEILPKPGGSGGKRNSKSGPDPALDGPPIPEGQRNEELFKIGCSARAKNMSRNAILGLLYDVNQTRCKPPIEDANELEMIADSVMRYDPGSSTDLPQWPPKDLAEANPEDANAGEPGRRHDTDWGNGRRLVDKYGDEIRYCKQMRTWFYWTGKRWTEDQLNKIKWFAGQTALSIYQESADAKARGDEELSTALWKWAKQSESNAKINAMVEQAEADPRVSVEPHQFDCDDYLFNTPNGTWDLRTFTFKPHDPADLLTTMCPTNYREGATDEVWNKAITEALPDPVMRQYFQRFFGTCLTGDTREKVVLIPNGRHDTGKSTITEAIIKTLGDTLNGGYASSWEAEVVQSNSNANREEKLHKVRTARLVVTGELDAGSRMADAFVKKLSGGDTMDARALYQGSFSLRPKFKLVLPTNYVPRSPDPALQKRLRLIPFEHTPDVIDRSIKIHLETDVRAHEAILAWMVEGWRQYQSEKSLGETPWLAKELARYMKDSDPVLEFVLSILTQHPDPAYSIPAELVWKLWQAWSGEFLQKRQQLARRTFEKALEERGYSRKRIPNGGRYCWEGLVVQAISDLPGSCQNVIHTWQMTNPPVNSIAV